MRISCSSPMSTRPARRRSRGSAAMRWLPASPRTGIAMCAASVARRILQRRSANWRSPATWSSALARDRSQTGPMRSPPSWQSSMDERRPMTAQNGSESNLLRRLPPVRGRLTANAPIGPMTLFRVGGPAEALFRPADTEDLAAFLAALPLDIPVTVIGVGSNLLVRDGGIPGIVIRLGRGFVGVATEGETVRAGAGALDLNVALTCREAGIAGLEFLSGIPGTLGGALRMSAGAYGREIKDVLRGAIALDGKSKRHVVPAAALGLAYRHCAAPADWIFVAAEPAGNAGDPAEIGRRMDEIRAAREASQPIRART